MGKTPTCLTCSTDLEETDSGVYTCPNNDCNMVSVESDLSETHLADLLEDAKAT